MMIKGIISIVLMGVMTGYIIFMIDACNQRSKIRCGYDVYQNGIVIDSKCERYDSGHCGNFGNRGIYYKRNNMKCE